MQPELVGEMFAAELRIVFVFGPQSPEGAVASFGAGQIEQIVQGVGSLNIVEGAQRREGGGAEGGFGFGGGDQGGNAAGIVEIGERFGGAEANFGVGGVETLLEDADAVFADRLQANGGGGGGDRIEQLTFELFQAIELLLLRFGDGDAFDDLQVAAQVVFVAGMNFERDECIALGRGDALLSCP